MAEIFDGVVVSEVVDGVVVSEVVDRVVVSEIIDRLDVVKEVEDEMPKHTSIDVKLWSTTV